MSQRHLTRSGTEVWCGSAIGDLEDDPRDATCTECLREAAGYGAAAAMRCAAVEAGGGGDRELERERDYAVQELDKLRGVLGQNGLFACAGCSRLFHVDAVGFHVGFQAWCGDCSAARGRVL